MTIENPPIRVLVVDDNEADRVLYQRLLSRVDSHEFVFSEAESHEEALSLLAKRSVDCVLLDYCLPDCYGLEVVVDPEFAAHAVPVVMLTGLGSVAVAKDAMKAGVHDCLNKRNVTSDGLLQAVLGAIAAGKLNRPIAQSS